jgi:hypothetical protein
MRRTLRLAFLLVVLTLPACVPGATTDSTSAPVQTSTTVPETTTTTVAEPPGIEELPAALQEELEELIARTQEIRGLVFLEQPTIDVVTPEELEIRTRQIVEEETENIEVDQATYELLGLLEGGTDLVQLFADLYGEQVAGYYDLDTRDLVVPMRQEGFSALERTTIVHELTHALTDQHFGLGGTFEALVDEERFDEASAFQALLEGDAVYTELLYLQDLDFDEQRAVVDESLGAETATLDAAPQFLQESLFFPYLDGPRFVQRLHELGGFERVDAAYADPPVSTEQILSPQDFGTDQPVTVAVPAITIDGYTLEYDTVWGELGFELMFNQALGGRVEAANGWGGDRALTFFDGTNAVLVIAYRGDTAADAAEMESALLEYVPAAMAVGESVAHESGSSFTGDDFAFVGSAEGTVWFVATGDPDLGPTVVELIQSG